jgi:NAD+ diphosphatase
VSFRLVAPPRLSRATVVRDEPLRLDTARQLAAWPKARVLVVDDKGRAAVRPVGDGAEYAVVTRPASHFGSKPPADAVVLGEQDGVVYWAVRGQPSLVGAESSGSGTSIGAESSVSGTSIGAESSGSGTSIGAESSVSGTSIGAESSVSGTSIGADDPGEWYDLRARGADLDATSAGLMVSAVAVLAWHDTARFCGRCGSPTEPRNSGWMRACTRCGHEEYPRTDPAIICLVHDGGTGDAARVLLARQPVWPVGRYSVLAGFVEAGESLEACVAREIAEEVGVTVSEIRYLGSQAWPFPRSLMIGFSAIADPEQPLHPADGEIAEAFWLTRAELRDALSGGDWVTNSGDQLLLPPSVSIARSMLESWAQSD